MKALIAGGGIAGLTSVIALAHTGWQVDLFEQAPAIAEVGAGLQLGPNAIKVLRALGLGEAARYAGLRPRAMTLRHGGNGRPIFSLPLGDAAESRWGAPYIQIHRADLVALLLEAAEAMPGVRIHKGQRVTGYRPDGDKVLLQTGGDEFSGDLLVAADGLRSAIGAAMAGGGAPLFTGHMAWRATVPVARLGRHAPPPEASVWIGPARHAVTYLLRGGNLANIVAVVERDGGSAEDWHLTGARSDALKDFAGWHPTIRIMLGEADTLYRWALFDRKPRAQWHDGHAVLIGDAAHPMLPYLAQGAAMAIEDAWVLARCLAAHDGIADALGQYQKLRQPRTSRVQAMARTNGQHFHQRGPVSRLVSGNILGLAGRFGANALRAQMDWLYGHDVTGG